MSHHDPWKIREGRFNYQPVRTTERAMISICGLVLNRQATGN